MEAPKCRICGERHYGVCGKAGRQKVRQTEQQIVLPRDEIAPIEAVQGCQECPKKDAEIEKLKLSLAKTHDAEMVAEIARLNRLIAAGRKVDPIKDAERKKKNAERVRKWREKKARGGKCNS